MKRYIDDVLAATLIRAARGVPLIAETLEEVMREVTNPQFRYYICDRILNEIYAVLETVYKPGVENDL